MSRTTVLAHDSATLDEALTRTERLAGLGTLTASIAHELANPLSIITATSANLRTQAAEGKLTSAQLLDYLDIIERSAWRGVRLIEALRGYSHPDSQRKGLVRLEEIVDAALTLIEHAPVGQEPIQITMDVAPGLAPVAGDRNQLIQVLLNLLLNAQDALAEQGGRVLVRVRAVGDGQTVEVRDTGPGLAPEIVPYLFQPFFTTKPRGQGTGLGLAVARDIVRAHGGRLKADNHPEGGALFTVFLPA
ncbi:MAG: ATP-binding protein [Candidatus Promineifilaceae bacterium]|nr:ATP-binding protein [Candidatus Promineifilaceae bacterium]